MAESESSDKIKDIVFQYANRSNGNIGATVLVNILSKIMKGENNFNTSDQLDRIKKIEDDLELFKQGGGDNQEKIQAIQDSIDNLKSSIQKSDLALKTKVDEMIIHYDNRVEKLEQLSTLQILQINERERRDRSFSIKVHNYADYSTSGQPLVQHIFDKLLKPCLIDANKHGELDEVPDSWMQCIEYGHPLGNNRDTTAPRNFIIRLRSRYYLDAILKHKRAHVDGLNEQNLSTSKSYAESVRSGKLYPCRIGIDTTALDRDVLSWLCRHNEVHRAYLRGQRIVFSLRNKQQQFFTVQNPYGRTLKELISPVIDEKKWIRSKNKQSPFAQPAYINGRSNERHLLDMLNPTKQNPLLMDEEDDLTEEVIIDGVTNIEDTDNSKKATAANKKRKHAFTPLKLFDENNRSPAVKQLKFNTPLQNRFGILPPEITLDAEDSILRQLPQGGPLHQRINETKEKINTETASLSDKIVDNAMVSEIALTLIESEMSDLKKKKDSRTSSAENTRNTSRNVSPSIDTAINDTSTEAIEDEEPKKQRKPRTCRSSQQTTGN